MRGLFIHTVVFAVVNALLVGIWLLTTGSTDTLSMVHTDPVHYVKEGFWPLIPATVWAGALIIHTAVFVGGLLPGSRRRERRKDARRERHHQLAQQRPLPHWLPTPPPPPIPPVSDFGKQAAQAAIGLVETLAGRAASRPSHPPASTPGRHWVAVMFTDLVGSTGLAEKLGDTTWSEMLVNHRQHVRECINSHGGTEVGTQGDGFLVRFDTPDNAIGCAISLQRQMDETRQGGALVPELRVGIHAGEAVADDNDLVGRVINLAARVVDAAEPGEILITEPVADHLSPGIGLIDRGLRPLKGFAQPRHLLAVAWRDTSDETIVLTTEVEN